MSRGRWAKAACILVVAVLVTALFSRTLFLCVYKPGATWPVCRVAVRPGYEFATWIIHSVQLTPVIEYFTVGGDGRITATGMDLEDLGWGLPSTVASTLKVARGKVMIRGCAVTLTELPFRVSYINEPKLILMTDKTVVPLSAIARDGDGLRIRVEKGPGYLRYLGGMKHAQFAVPFAQAWAELEERAVAGRTPGPDEGSDGEKP